MRILITRPIKESKELAEKLRELGHEAVIYPLTEIIISQDIKIPEADGYIITSRNAVKAIKAHIRPLTELAFVKKFAGSSEAQKQNIHLVHEDLSAEVVQKLPTEIGPCKKSIIDKPIFIVGKQTTNFAKSLGFQKAIYAGKDIVELKSELKKNWQHLDLIYLSGQEVTDNLIDFIVAREIIYYTKPIQPIASDFERTLAQIEIILFFSSNIAKIFIDFVNNNRLQSYCNNIYAICLSTKIANILKTLKFKELKISEQPTQESIIELINRG